MGGTVPIHVNVRIIAATHRNLEKAVREGSFREDLYYRLAVFPIEMPALKDRREDIPLLTEHFVGHFSKELRRPAPRVSKEALCILENYAWPGNVRQLKNVIERTLVLASQDEIFPEDLPWDIRTPSAQNTSQSPLNFKAAQEGFEKEFFHRLLQETQGNVSQAAELANLDRSHLHEKLKKHGLQPARYKLT